MKSYILYCHANCRSMKKSLLLIVLLLALAVSGWSQVDTSLKVVKTSSIQNNFFLSKYTYIFVDADNKATLSNLRETQFRSPGSLPDKSIRKKNLIDNYVYLLYHFSNDQDTSRNLFITSGTFTKEIYLFKRSSNSNKWEEIKDSLPDNGELAYRRFTIRAGENFDLLLKVKFARTNVAVYKPNVIDKSSYHYHVNFIHTHWFGLDIVTYLISGLLLMMLLFSLANYFQNYKKEFLYYSIYAFLFGMMLFLKALNYKLSTSFTFFNEEYLDYFMQIVGYIFYIGFSRLFLNAPRLFPLLNKLFILAEIALALFLAVFTYAWLNGNSYEILNNTENYSKFFMIFIGLTYLVLGIIQPNKLMNYLLAGNVANLLMGGFSQFMVLFPNSPILPESGIFLQSLFYFELGILLELIFFLAGLVYKNKIELIEKVKMDEAIKQEQEKQGLEKEIAVLRAQQDERSRISADMHDELGSGVTAIRLLSEIAIKKTKEQPVDEIAKISDNANDLMAKMNGIIWSMNPGNDTLDSMISYIRSYASEYLDTFDMDYAIHIPNDIPPIEISGTKRRNLFLVIKEALNNTIKHAKASKVTLNVYFNHTLHIEISDNGKGIDESKLNQFGNGLHNMQKRMKNIGGSFSVQSMNGTTIVLTMPLTDEI